MLQTPVVFLANEADGRRAAVVLTAHLGEPAYYSKLRAVIGRSKGTIYFESVRSTDDSEEHWQERYHAFLRTLREQIYSGIAGVGPLAFQGDHLVLESEWVNADVDCCALAAKLREAKVPLSRYTVAFAVIERVIGKAEGGDAVARKALERSIKWGLLAISLPFVLELAERMPRTRGLFEVINEWRSGEAVALASRSEGDFVLVYGAAHGRSLLRGLARHGFTEVRRDWVTVFSA